MISPFCFLLASGDSVTILREMLLVFVSAKLLAEIAERIKQPSIVGELLAGILIGPALLGWVLPNHFLTALAELGVLFLLFRVGLEFKDFDLAKVGSTALVVAMLGVALPFLAGWGILVAFGMSNLEGVFVGAAMVATSIGITARVLASKGLLQERASKIILAAAVIDDVLGLIVLAAVSSVARGRVNVVELISTAGLALGFTFLVAKWGARTVSKMAPQVHKRLRAEGGEFTVAVVLLFGLSTIAVYAGVAAIIGAFLAGMALADSVSEQVHDMVNGMTELVVPFFLVGIGLHLDLAVLRNPATLSLALVVLIAAVASKLIGCGLGAYRLGWADATRVGVGMIPRGEVGMVVAQIGLGMRVIPPAIYGIVVIMSIATTIIAPPLLKLAYRGAPQSVDGVRRLPRIG
jgi:Kef-type K+ transport system membrane component KefB